MRTRYKICLAVATTLIAWSILLAFFYFSIYPQYLQFLPKYHFQNDYYTLEMTSFITKLYVGDHNVCGYYSMFSLEENYEDAWELECFGRQIIDGTNVYTESYLFTYAIFKNWTFYLDKPYFTLTIKRIYQSNSSNMNNQIIIDVNHLGYVTDNEAQVICNLEHGVFGFKILSSNQPIMIQLPSEGCPSEFQLNFHGQSDRDSRFHCAGETEIVKLLVYINQNGDYGMVESEFQNH